MTRDLILTQSSAQGKYDEYYKERKKLRRQKGKVQKKESGLRPLNLTWWISSWECPDYGCWISLDESLAENVRITAAESHLMIL